MKHAVLGALLLWLCACASSNAPTAPAPGGVLEPVEAAAPEEAASLEPQAAPSLAALQAKLAELGYTGVGLEHESEPVVALLLSVFSDPAAARRKIGSVYTGAELAYDAEAESLTIGGTTDLKAILSFIKKKVPPHKPR